MPQLHHSSNWFARGGLLLFVAQLWLFVFALKPFHYGTWYQVEPTTLAMFILAGLNAAWLALGFARGWLHLLKPLSPVLLCLLAWLGWQYIATLLSSSPWRSWFGQPAIGIGAGYYTALLLSYLLALALWPRVAYQRIMLAAGALALGLMAWLHFEPQTLCETAALDGPAESMAAGNWADYLAFLLAYLWIAFAGANRVRTPALYAIGVAVFFAIIAYVAESMAAKILFYPALAIGGGVLWLHIARRPRWLTPGKGWRIAASIGCLLPALWLAASQHPSWVNYNSCSLPTRALFNQVSVSALAHEPLRLLKGDGWGSYADDLYKYAILDGVTIFNDGNRRPNWSAADGHSYHSHNEFAENLLALGIPGMLLWLLLPVTLLWTMPRRQFWWCAPMLLAIHAFQSLWFFLPQVLAFQSIFLASSTSRRGLTFSKMRGLSLIAGIMVVVMCASAYGHWQGMRYGHALSAALSSDASPDAFPTKWLAEDLKRGGERFHSAAEYFGKRMMEKSVNGTVTEQDAQWYGRFMEAASLMAGAPHAGAWLVSTDMWLKNFLFMNAYTTTLDTLKPAAKQSLIASVLTATARMPQREDVTSLVLYSLDAFTGGDAAKAKEILQQILAINPDHRAALWVLGRQLLADPATQEKGWVMLQRAKALGVGAVFPATNAELARVP